MISAILRLGLFSPSTRPGGFRFNLIHVMLGLAFALVLFSVYAVTVKLSNFANNYIVSQQYLKSTEDLSRDYSISYTNLYNYKQTVNTSNIVSVIKRYDYKLLGEQPQNIANYIIKNAQKYNVDPVLATALIMTESAFDTTAVSNVGAIGLMQLLPTTASFIARECNVPVSNATADLLDPYKNMALGLCYFGMLTQHYGNEEKYAIIAYNYGPGNLDRFLRRNSKLPILYYDMVLQRYRVILDKINASK